MATYIVLWRFTPKGIQNIKESPSRIDAGREVFRAHGVTMKGYYVTLGQYDGLLVLEAPNATAVAEAMLDVGRLGNVSTETLRAFTEDEYRQIVATLP